MDGLGWLSRPMTHGAPDPMICSLSFNLVFGEAFFCKVIHVQWKDPPFLMGKSTINGRFQ